MDSYSFYSCQYNSMASVTQAPTFVDSQNLIPKVIMPTQHCMPPRSPPWGSEAKKYVNMNVSFKLKPLGVASLQSGPKLQGVENFLMCQMVPVVAGLSFRYQRKKLQRVLSNRAKRKAAVGKSVLCTNLRQRKLKRLQRGPFNKLKRAEVHEKWNRKSVRREFQRRRQRLFAPPGTQTRTTTATRTTTTVHGVLKVLSEGSDSPFKCPLWYCNRSSTRRRYATEASHFGRRQSSSDLSSLSRRSRSPIIIRRSPLP